MNSDHVINGWIAQLSLDARGRRAERRPRTASPAPLSENVEVTAQPALPARPRARLLPVRGWARDGGPARALGRPCLVGGLAVSRAQATRAERHRH